VKWDRSKPFPQGHTFALKHGAFSLTTLEPVVREVVEAAQRAVPYLGDDVYRSAVLAWAYGEARVIRVRAWLTEHGELDGNGKPRPAAEFAVRAEKLATDLRARLGLDPLSRARLQREMAGLQAELSRREAEAALATYRPAGPQPSSAVPDGSMADKPDAAEGDAP
jgi:hypothetical protein